MEPNNKNRNFNKGREICFELKKRHVLKTTDLLEKFTGRW